MDLDPLVLSRFQFFWVVAFHILLPAFTIGLAHFVAVLEAFHLATKKETYLRLSIYWTKIFAVSFGMGVVSGIVMPFQFGTNWSRFSDLAGDVIGPLMAYEGLTAFFLEAGFLGILLFGRKLVPPWVHLFSAVMVALGTLFSAFWILSVNSWMHTPAGYVLIEGRYFPENWWQVIFNPSFPYRLAHTVTAFFITTAFVVVGASAYLLRKGKDVEEARTMLSMTFKLLTLLVPLQIIIGDLHGLNTLAYQPVKIAAVEGLWETQPRAPAVLFAIPDQEKERNRFEVSIPMLASLYLTHDADGVVRGLKEWPKSERPPVTIVFWAFRIMVGVGLIMLAMVVVSWLLRARGRLYEAKRFLRLCEWCAPLGFIAVIAGWVTTEVGRQPYVIYGLMRTSEALSPSVRGADVLASLILYIAVYIVVFGVGGAFLLRLITRGPSATVEPHAPKLDERPARPLSAARREDVS